jgi:hypothetical protein
VTSWVLTKGLQHLRNEVNYTFPNRSKASDGTIGDLAHMAETSGHNPDDTAGSKAEYNDHDGIPEVRAWDCTSDFGDGVDAQDVVDHLRSLRGLSSVIRYMIYNRKMYQASNGWKAEAYTGPSAHTEHIHFSGARTQASDNNNTFDYRLEEIPVALNAADKSWIAGQIDETVGKYFAKSKQSDGTPTSTAGDTVLSQGIPNGMRQGAPRDPAYKVIQDLGAELLEQKGQLAEIKALVGPPPAKA